MAKLFADFKNYKNQKIELTGIDQKSFQEVTKLINVILDINLKYISPDPINYYVGKKHQGMDQGEIIVRIMLHLLQRFQSTSPLTDQYEKIVNDQPNRLENFVRRRKEKFLE